MAKKILKGTVVSAKPLDTVIVNVTRSYVHPKYKKRVNCSKNYVAHGSGVEVGSFVTIQESAPISKTKKWLLIKG